MPRALERAKQRQDVDFPRERPEPCDDGLWEVSEREMGDEGLRRAVRVKRRAGFLGGLARAGFLEGYGGHAGGLAHVWEEWKLPRFK